MRQGSKFMLLENSVEHIHDIDEESLQDDSSIEEIRLDDQPRERLNKKQKQTRNHILIFKNPKGALDKEQLESHERIRRSSSFDSLSY